MEETKTMNIITRQVTIRELVENFVEDDEDGVFAYGGKLTVRPKYQRNFCYDIKKQTAVVATVASNLPLGVLYWTEEEDENGNISYQCLDGQQRTLSICHYVTGALDEIKFEKSDLRYFPDLNYYNVAFDSLDDDRQEKILNYTLDVKIIKGSDMETKLAFFSRLNIAGAKIENQELLNAIYCGTFVEDAKAFFSKRDCEGSKYHDIINVDENRQQLLEKALEWITDKANPNRPAESPAEYMQKHRKDKKAGALKQEFIKICSWARTLFVGLKTSKIIRNKDWGRLYYTYRNKDYSDRDLAKEAEELFKNSDIKKAGIVEYLLSGNEALLQPRVFDRGLVELKLKEQNCKCKMCGKKLILKDAQGDHILPVSKGGKTEYANLQVLCAECNNNKSDDIIE